MTSIPSSRSEVRGDVSGVRVVRTGGDGIWLNYDPLILAKRYRGSAQHLRGIPRKPCPGQQIDILKIDEHCHPVRIVGFKCGAFDIAVCNSAAANAGSVQPFLLSATGRFVGGFGFGGLNVHVHPALITRVGERQAVVTARAWANHLLLSLPSEKIVECERVSRSDYAVDILVDKGGTDDFGPGICEQVVSQCRGKAPYFATGWQVGLIAQAGHSEDDAQDEQREKKDGDEQRQNKSRMRQVIVAYDKIQERRDKRGVDGVREYVASLNDPQLKVDEAGVVSRDGKEIRIWRVEFRFHREFLHDSKISNADEALAKVPSLLATAARATRMHERSGTGRVYRTNRVTPFWKLVQEAIEDNLVSLK